MNILDIKVLTYISRRKSVSNAILEKKFGIASRIMTENLEKAGNSVDYIITYDVGFKLRSMLKMESNCFNNLHAYLNEVATNCKFKTWFFGCFHMDKRIPPIYHAVYRNIYEIESGKEL